MLATLNHDIDPRKRSTMHPAPIVIGNNVSIGANATVVPGVTIGEGAIKKSGLYDQVVTRKLSKGKTYICISASASCFQIWRQNLCWS